MGVWGGKVGYMGGQVRGQGREGQGWGGIGGVQGLRGCSAPGPRPRAHTLGSLWLID